MPENNRDDSGKFSEQVTQLETAIANERVLLAKVKVKRKRLSAQVSYDQLLVALERDINKQLTKLQKQYKDLTQKLA